MRSLSTNSKKQRIESVGTAAASKIVGLGGTDAYKEGMGRGKQSMMC